jgi:hypothetical protein
LGGATKTVVLDNLGEGVLKPDIYDPALNPLKKHFPGHPFTSKDLLLELGLSRATSTRIITRLMSAGVIRKVSYGSYLLAEAV